MRWRIRRDVGIVVALVVLVVTSGCSGIVNPYVSWDRRVGQGDTVSINQAVIYADRAKDAYRDALGNQSKLASWLGIGLIPLMAAAAGLGITGGPPAAIAATTLAGAAGYGVGVWLYSKPSQRAWVAGYNATSCAVSAVIPLRDVYQRRSDILANVAVLDAKRDAATVAKRELETAIAAAIGLENSEQVVRGNQLLKDVDDLLATSASTRSNARRLLVQADTAGMLLKEAVDRIYGQVAAQLVETSQDLQALASIVGGLAQTYKGFSSVVESVKPPPPPGTKAQGAGQAPLTGTERMDRLMDVTKASERLETAMRELTNANRALSDDVDRTAGAMPIETLRACGVTAEQVSTPLSVEPAGGITIEEKTPVTEGRVVRGGASPYSVVLQGALTDLSVRQTEPFGSAFVLQTTDKTPAGKTTVFVSDRSGNKLFIPVTVTAKSSGGGGSAAPGTTPASPEAAALKEVAKGIPGTSARLTDTVTVVVDSAELKESDKKVLVDVSLRKGTALVPAQEGAAISDADITKALLSLPAVKGAGLAAGNFAIRTRKPPSP